MKIYGWMTLTALTLSTTVMAQQPLLQDQAVLPSQAHPTVTMPNQETQPSLITPPAAPLAFDDRNRWLSAKAVKLQVLDKVNGQATTLIVQAGRSVEFGSLTIMVRSCVVRLPDQPADSAGYLNVADNHSDSLSFSGWLLANEPSMSMMQHPIYDIRVVGCV